MGVGVVGGEISRVGYSVNGGLWREARLSGPNIGGARVRWGFVWDARPGTHEMRVRDVDEAGNAQPDAVGWNDLGYLYDGVVG